MSNRTAPAVQVIYPRAELRMIADQLGPAFAEVARVIRGCLDAEGGMTVLAIRAAAWGRQVPALRDLAPVIVDYAQAAQRAAA